MYTSIHRLPFVLGLSESRNRHKLSRSTKNPFTKMKGTDDTVAKGNEETNSPLLFFLLYWYTYLGNIQVTATWVYRSSYSHQAENSFSKYAKPPPHTHFHSFLFVITGKGNCECFTCCPGFSAARLNLVNQKVKIKSEWKLREKQPSNDRDTRQWRMMLLLQGSSSSTQGLGITIWLCKRISLILQK